MSAKKKRTFTPEQMKARAEAAKRWYWRNVEVARARQNRYYHENRPVLIEKMKAWREKLGSKYRESYRKHAVKKKYGLTLEEYDALTGDSLCGLCGKGPDGRGPTGQRLHIDHDHFTGAIRGVLCRECNVGLGMFKDDIDLLKKAVKYLTSHGKKVSK